MKRSAIIVVTVIVLSLVIGTALYLTSSKSNMPAMQPASTSTNTNTTTPTTNTTQPSMSTDKVSISNFSYSPSAITVKKGTTVTWTNLDDTAHTVTENDSKQGPTSGSLAKNATYSFTYNQTGTFSYHCTFHPNMLATVTVTE